MVKTIALSYIHIYETANNESLTITERNNLLNSLLVVHELMARVDEDVSYMMSTFNTYDATVEWLKALVDSMEGEE